MGVGLDAVAGRTNPLEGYGILLIFPGLVAGLIPFYLVITSMLTRKHWTMSFVALALFMAVFLTVTGFVLKSWKRYKRRRTHMLARAARYFMPAVIGIIAPVLVSMAVRALPHMTVSGIPYVVQAAFWWCLILLPFRIALLLMPPVRWTNIAVGTVVFAFSFIFTVIR